MTLSELIHRASNLKMALRRMRVTDERYIEMIVELSDLEDKISDHLKKSSCEHC